jgi:hypothetical protein
MFNGDGDRLEQFARDLQEDFLGLTDGNFYCEHWLLDGVTFVLFLGGALGLLLVDTTMC